MDSDLGARGPSTSALDFTQFRPLRQRRVDTRLLRRRPDYPGIPSEPKPPLPVTGDDAPARQRELRNLSARFDANNAAVNAVPLTRDEGILPLPSESPYMYSSSPQSSAAHRLERPVSWHPSVNSSEFEGFPRYDTSDEFALRSFSAASMDDFADSRRSLQTGHFAPSFGIEGDQAFAAPLPYHHFFPDWQDNSGSQTQMQYHQWVPGYDASLFHHASPRFLNFATSQQDSTWMQQGAISHDSYDSSSFMTPKVDMSPSTFQSLEGSYDLLATISNRTLTAADVMSEANGTDKELVGLGLYDNEESSSYAPTNYPGTSMFGVFSQANGKGLKLEETFQPPADLSSEDDDEDDDQESLSEDESTRTTSFDYNRDFVPDLQHGYIWTTPVQPLSAMDQIVYQNYPQQPQEGLDGAAEALRMWSLWDSSTN